VDQVQHDDLKRQVASLQAHLGAEATSVNWSAVVKTLITVLQALVDSGLIKDNQGPMPPSKRGR
jgi:hypothetical protein